MTVPSGARTAPASRSWTYSRKRSFPTRVALVVDGAARRAQQAAQARAEAALLASFSRTVLTRDDPLPRLLEKIREAFGLTSVAILQRSDGRWAAAACAGPAECFRPEDADVDVAVELETHLVGRGRALTAVERRLLDAVAGQALLALRNQQVGTEAAEARRRADATELRSQLLSAVGHDLRTPLASIKAAAGSLRDPTLRLSEADRSELAATVEESADRLTGVVDNLLDSSRIATGAISAELESVGYDEVAALAVRGLDTLTASTSISPTTSRTSSRTPACWNGSSPTWSTTPCATAAAPRLRCAPAPTPTASSCASSTPAPAFPAAGLTACSPRSSGSATASRAASAWV
jgi:signal transduction histidine kinase